jgi:hypothetical protein
MTNIYYRITQNDSEQTGTINVTATDLISVLTELRKDFPNATIEHYHIIGDGCLCGEGQ